MSAVKKLFDKPIFPGIGKPVGFLNSGLHGGKYRIDSNNIFRNYMMTQHLAMAGTSGEDDLKLLCEVLTFNYYALEAYVPYASILDMLTLQGVINVDDFKVKENRDFASTLSQNGVIDAMLMNYAYAIQHFIEAKVEDKKEKFGKYTARLYRLSTLLEDVASKKCWADAFRIINAVPKYKVFSKVNKDALEEVKKIREQIEATIGTSKNSDYDFIKTSFMKCVGDLLPIKARRRMKRLRSNK